MEHSLDGSNSQKRGLVQENASCSSEGTIDKSVAKVVDRSDEDGDVSSEKSKVEHKRSAQGHEYAFTKAPPPIKTRREHSHTASPPDLSPPPSPKRMRELERKEGAFNSVVVPRQKLQEQNS